MTGVRLSDIATKASALGGSERIEVTQSGATRYTDPAQLATYVGSVLGGGVKVAQVGNTSTATVSASTTFGDFPVATELFDPDGIVTVSGTSPNRHTLGAGTYLAVVALHGALIHSADPGLSTFRARLYNQSDTASLSVAVQTGLFLNDNGSGDWFAPVGVTMLTAFTLASSKELIVQVQSSISGGQFQMIPDGSGGAASATVTYLKLA